MTKEEILAYVNEVEERVGKATANPTLMRYDHGGGRALHEERCGPIRKLIADYYDEGNREFYHNARTDVPKLCQIIREQQIEIEKMREDLKQQERAAIKEIVKAGNSGGTWSRT